MFMLSFLLTLMDSRRFDVDDGSFRRSSYSRPVSRSSSFAMYQQPQQQHDAPALHASDS
jgi:hypothetical protein